MVISDPFWSLFKLSFIPFFCLSGDPKSVFFLFLCSVTINNDCITVKGVVPTFLFYVEIKGGFEGPKNKQKHVYPRMSAKIPESMRNNLVSIKFNLMVFFD